MGTVIVRVLLTAPILVPLFLVFAAAFVAALLIEWLAELTRARPQLESAP